MAKNPNVIATNRLETGKIYFMHVMNNKANGINVRLVGYFHNGIACKVMPKMKELKHGLDELRVMNIENNELLTLTVPEPGYIFTLGGKRMTFMKCANTDAPLEIAGPIAEEVPVEEVTEQAVTEPEAPKEAKKSRKSRKAVAA